MLELGQGIVLGLEMKDSLNVAAWVSYEGVSVVPYPEETACSLFEKEFGKEFDINKKVFSHSDFVKAVSDDFFPDFFLESHLIKQKRKCFFVAILRSVLIWVLRKSGLTFSFSKWKYALYCEYKAKSIFV